MKTLALVLGLAAAFLLYDPEAGALTMEEAVGVALKNNHQIKRFGHLERSSEEGAGAARAGFYPSLDLSYAHTESSEELFFTGGWNFTAAASYNLFRGFSDVQNLRGARSQALASRYQKRAVVADTVLSVRSAYIEVLRARRLEETARESVELLERQGRDAELFYREGLIAKNDFLEVQVELASARQELLQAEGNVRVARKRLERAMGAPLPDEEQLVDLEQPPERIDLQFESLEEEMLENRSELRNLRARRDAERYAMESIWGGYLPEVNLTASYQVQEETALARLTGISNEETRGVITAQWNLFDGFGTTHRKNRAEYLMRAVEEEIRDTEDELVFQLRETLEDYRIARGRLEVAEAAISQAEENYRVTESQFRERLATTTDLLDARTFLTRARTQYFNALYDIQAAASRIERVVERVNYGGADYSVKN